MRRPREYAHIYNGVQHTATAQVWRSSSDPKVSSALWRWHCGMVIYRERQWRHDRGRDRVSPYCPWCFHSQERICVETLEHIILHCPQWAVHKTKQLWMQRLDWVDWRVVHNGCLPSSTQMTARQRADWRQWQREVAQIIIAREAQLHEFERDKEPPPCPPTPQQTPQGTQPRRRLRGKQPPPPQDRVIKGQRRTRVESQQHSDGSWRFAGHHIVALPPEQHPPRFVWCLRCRRSAAITAKCSVEQALAIVGKRNRGACTPSAVRFRVSATLANDLPKTHLVDSPAPMATSARVPDGTPARRLPTTTTCTICKSSTTWKGPNPPAAWVNRHVICYWQLPEIQPIEQEDAAEEERKPHSS